MPQPVTTDDVKRVERAVDRCTDTVTVRFAGVLMLAAWFVVVALL